MASPSKADDAPAPLRGTVELAAGLRSRRRAVVARPLPRIGDLGRAARRFGSLTFLSASARRVAYATYQGLRVADQLVRPPDYWVGFQPELMESVSRVRTGDAAYDRLVAQRAAAHRARKARAAMGVQRGLPSTIHRRSYSIAGPMTAPGAVARRLQATVVTPTPNPANSPQTAAARSTSRRSTSRPATGNRGRGDDARPPAPSSSPSRVAPSTATSTSPSTLPPLFVASTTPGVVDATKNVTGRSSERSPAFASASVGVGAADVQRALAEPGARVTSPFFVESADAPSSFFVDSAAPGAVESTKNERRVGRPVAARAMLSAWQHPTLWRSVATSVPGVRLVPVGAPAPMEVATSLPARELAGLPVGAPAAVVSRTVTSEPSIAARRSPTSATGSVPSASTAARRGEPASSSSSAPTPSARAVRPSTSSSAGATPVASPGSVSVSSSSPATVRRSIAPTAPSSPASASTAPASVAATGRAGAPTWVAVPSIGAVSSSARAAAAAAATTAPGHRAEHVRRPGRWLARSAVRVAVPEGPLGRVRWSTSADLPSLFVPAADVRSAATSAGIRPPVTGGLTLVRGGRDTADVTAPTPGRATAAPVSTGADRGLRLVHPSRGDTAETARVVAAGGPPPTTYTAEIGRLATSAVPFAGVPGAVARHGLPSAAWSVLGLPGRVTSPLGSRTTATETVRRRELPAPMAAALVVRGEDVGATTAAPSTRARLAHGAPARRVRPAAVTDVATRADVPVVAAHWSMPTSVAATRRTPESGAASMVWAYGSGIALAGPGGADRVPVGSALARPGGVARAGVAEPVRRRPLPAPMPGTIVLRSPAEGGGGDAPARATARGLGLPATPAGVARRRAAVTVAMPAPAPAPGSSAAGSDRHGRRAHHPVAGDVASAARWSAADGMWAVASAGPGRGGQSPMIGAGHVDAGRVAVASLRGLPVAPGVLVGGGPVATSTLAGRATASSATTSTGPRARATDDEPRRTLPGRLAPSSPHAPARFQEVLRSAPPVRPAALPVRFRPLAERIVGRRPVHVAHGLASRRALAAVGAQAATISSVIHLPSRPDGSARTAALVAHELAHVAAGSPEPRFHGGRRDREELEAVSLERAVGRAARTLDAGRGPANPGTSGLPVAGFVGVRGATSGPAVPASAAAASTATGTTTYSRNSAGEVIRRSPDSSGSGSGSGDDGGSTGTIRRQASGSGGSRNGVIRRDLAIAEAVEDTGADPIAGLSEDALDAIITSLEQRLIEAIERRGGLWRGGF